MDVNVVNELEMIRRKNRGILYPEAVVNFAVDENTALHSRFEWDDVKAGYEYRIWQARQLIKLVVTVIPSTNTEISAYVSLSDDRKEDGGYRSVIEVMSDDQLRNQMIDGAIKDFEYWEFRYKQLVELLPIFKAKERVKAKFKK